jgi:hypothetical protein
MKLAKFLLELFFLILVCLPVFCLAYLTIELSFFIYYFKKNLNKWKTSIIRRSRRK